MPQVCEILPKITPHPDEIPQGTEFRLGIGLRSREKRIRNVKKLLDSPLKTRCMHVATVKIVVYNRVPFSTLAEGKTATLKPSADYLSRSDQKKKEKLVEEDMVFNREKQAFKKLKPSLLRNPEYKNKFVAIAGGIVVDSDIDKVALVKRVFTTRGYAPIYVSKVATARRVIELPSPERL